MPDRSLRALLGDLTRFAVVGGFGLAVDLTVFNLLRVSLLADGRVAGAAMIAKSIAVIAAILTNWAGNRWWTFRTQRGLRLVSEAAKFFVVSLAGSGIALLCLAFSHYVLDLTSGLADNISANVVGLVLGSAFRFVAARTWIFRSGPGVPTLSVLSGAASLRQP